MASVKIVVFDGKNQKEVGSVGGLKINARGNCNLVKVHSSVSFENCSINMDSNCEVIIDATESKLSNICVFMNSYNKLEIGKNFSCYGAEFRMQEDFVSFKCGNDCCFEKDISVLASDGKSIFYEKGKRIINKGMLITLGNHVWVCRGVTLLKKAQVPDNVVVGLNSVVTKRIIKKNSIIAGCPAKVIKTGINWNKSSPSSYKNGK